MDVNYNNRFLNVWIFLFLCRELERRPTLILHQNAPPVYIGCYFLQWLRFFFFFLSFFLGGDGGYQNRDFSSHQLIYEENFDRFKCNGLLIKLLYGA